MKFQIASVSNRSDFPRWGQMGFSELLRHLYRLCLNTFVLALILACIDLYFNKSTPIGLEELVRQNIKVAFLGLVTMRVVFLALHNLMAAVLLSAIFTKHNYERNIGIFALLVSAGVTFLLKNHHIAASGLVFAYPTAILLLDVFIVLSLRSSIYSYVVRRD